MDRLRRLIFLGLLFLCSHIFAYSYREYYPLNSLFQQAIHDYAFPGGCIAAGSKNKIYLMRCFGYHTYEKKIPDQITDIFDLASVTKVVATTSAIMKLYEQGKIHLDDPVVKYLPDFKGATAAETALKARVRIRDLLAHASGLPPGHLVNKLHISIFRRWLATFETPEEYSPDRYTIYSDVNFEILGKIVEKVSGMPLDVFTRTFIFAPLRMNNTMFNPAAKYQDRLVPTSGAFSNREPQDEVADSLGGVSGNAGLFSTIEDLSRFAQMMLNGGRLNGVRIFKPETIRLFSARANLVPYSSRALGWDTVFNPDAYAKKRVIHNFTAGLYIDSDGIGLAGYTGTSIWISFKYNVFVILLTNRVLPCKGQIVSQSERYWRQQLTSVVWRNLGFTQMNPLYQEPLNKADRCNH